MNRLVLLQVPLFAVISYQTGLYAMRIVIACLVDVTRQATTKDACQNHQTVTIAMRIVIASQVDVTEMVS